MCDNERNTMTAHLEKHGFAWVDASGTRVVFDIELSMDSINSSRTFKHKPFTTPEGLFDYFSTVAKYIAFKHNLTLNMCQYREDPGLGIILPEDM
jgi:hypothetical protein